VAAYSPQYHRLDLRNQFSPTVSQALQAAGLSLGGIVCLPIDVSCKPTTAVAATNPLDTVTGLLGGATGRTSLGAPSPPASAGDRVTNGLGSVGHFFRSAARRILGFA
jgi:hypothetical protein